MITCSYQAYEGHIIVTVKIPSGVHLKHASLLHACHKSPDQHRPALSPHSESQILPPCKQTAAG